MKIRIIIVMIALVVGSGHPILSQAATMYDDRAAFVAGCSSTNDLDISGYYVDPWPPYTITAGTPIPLPSGNSLSFDADLQVFKVGTPYWGTWSGGNEPYILFNWFDLNLLTITGTFSEPVTAFGMEIEPSGSYVSITLTLNDGSYLTQPVNWNAGAEFFGYVDGTDITSFTISAGDLFAIGRMIEGTPLVPIPSAVWLLGSAFIGLVGLRKKIRKA